MRQPCKTENKISVVIFFITLCSTLNLTSAMERYGEAKKCEEENKEQQVRLPETRAEDSDSIIGTSSAVARLTLEEGVGPQEDNPATELPPEENLIPQFQTIVASVGFNEEEQHDLHRCLKQLQHAEFRNYQTSYFTWKTEVQQFVHYPEDPNVILSDLDDEVLEVLNAYVIYDRKKRRADVPAWQEQDPSHPSLLGTLLSPEINSSQSRLQIAHHNKEETFGPQTLDQGTIALPQDHAILLYGFNVPGKGGPRLQVKEKLQTLFAPRTIQAMNDYNKAIGLSAGGIKFLDYLKFLSEAKKRNLKSFISEEAPLSALPISRHQAEAWAEFLEQHLPSFDFSRRLTSPETTAKFVVKNYKNITTNRGLSKELKRAFDLGRAEDWSFITGYLEPILVCLRNVRTHLIAPELENAQLDQVAEILEMQSRFSHVQIPPAQQKDLQLVLSSIVSEAFFRTTSKLGLPFAQQQNIPVGFVWTHSFLPLDQPPLSSLEEFRDYIEKKPYYKTNFRRNSVDAKYPEAITCSEARHLGRLKASNKAPSFLLIRDIIESSSP